MKDKLIEEKKPAPSAIQQNNETEKIIKMLRHHKSGCFSCGYEHNCRQNGCALMQMAADNLEKLNDFEHSQLAIVMAENAQLRAAITQNDPDFFKRKCRVCGCDWNHPCEGGCYWVSDDLCSKCAGKEVKN